MENRPSNHSQVSVAVILPPGPIGNPGRGAIEATVNPDGSNYFYFVSRNDGTHVFSKTLAEHERYVDQYQREGAAPVASIGRGGPLAYPNARGPRSGRTVGSAAGGRR